MKTIDEIDTGLPSFETEWPKNAETDRDTTKPQTTWASGRLEHVLQSTIRPQQTSISMSKAGLLRHKHC